MNTDAMRSIECSPTIKNILCEALLNFAYFSDEIKNHADKSRIRQEILTLCHEIEQQFGEKNRVVELAPRDLQYCEQAINYHYDRIFHLLNANVDEQRKLMLDLLSGYPAGDEELDAALLRDNVL